MIKSAIKSSFYIPLQSSQKKDTIKKPLETKLILKRTQSLSQLSLAYHFGFIGVKEDHYR